ncbi:MAG: acyltransferase [Hyphomonadaceae bacterium]
MIPTFLQPSHVFKRDLDPSKYRLEIDGLRFFAIMNVMIGHLLERIQRFWMEPSPHFENAGANAVIDFFASPNQGVLLFFAISGFIIAKQMQDVPDGRFNAAYVGKYYVRRAARIFPPYYFVILSSFIAVYFLGLTPPGLNSFEKTAAVPIEQSFIASMFYAHGAVFDSLPRLFALGWSLEVEVQFYILAPIIFLTFFRGAHRAEPWRFVVFLALAFATSFVVMNKIAPVNSFTVLSYIIYFATGITMARHEMTMQRLFARIGSKASAVLGVICVLGMFWLGEAHFSPLPMTLIYWGLTLATIVVMFGLAFQPDTLFGKFCRIPAVTWIGMACYSLYLVHMQFFHLATLVLGKFATFNYLGLAIGFVGLMACALIGGAAFFAIVEKPFAGWRPFSKKRAPQPPAGEPKVESRGPF